MLSFISPDLTSPAAAQFYPAKSVRAGYSPGCCKRLQLQPLPQNPFTKLIFCFDTLEEAHQWTEAFQWCQQAREILDEADAAAAAALEVPVPRKVCWCHVKIVSCVIVLIDTMFSCFFLIFVRVRRKPKAEH